MLALATSLLLGCGVADPPPSAPAQAPAPAPAPTTSTPSTTPAPSTPPTDPPPSTDPAALTTYFDRSFNGGDLRIGGVREQTPRFTSYDVTYRSGRFTISGVLNVPTGRGPFPVVVLAHGWIDRDDYVRGQGMTRERGFLADNGFVAFHVDYRNHAESDDDPRLERSLYLGYAVDVINAVQALRASPEVPVDDDRVGVMGRSMGGVAVYQVLEMVPHLVDAGIAFAPQSSRETENYHHWTPSVYDAVRAARGSPEQDPQFWREASTRTYFDRIEVPVLIHQGGMDEQCRPIWARQTARAMRRAGVDVTLHWYADERHAFGPQFDLAMRRTVTFLNQHLA
jgi:dipeptidyl aminopeptidase/acylaminoacyl peptidase